MFGRVIFISESVAHIENTLKNNVNAQKIKQNFVNTQWIKFKENFPIDKSKFSKKIQEEAIKLLILQIIDKEENINEIRTEFNEKWDL